MFVTIFGIIFIASVGAKECMNFETKPLDIASFQGLWYQGVWDDRIHYDDLKQPEIAISAVDCARMYIKANGTDIKVINSHVKDNEQKYIEGTADYKADDKNHGVFTITLKMGETIKLAKISILTIDYRGVALAYVCNENNDDIVVILSRNKFLDDLESINGINTYLNSHYNETKSLKFLKTNFSRKGCHFDKTSPLDEF